MKKILSTNLAAMLAFMSLGLLPAATQATAGYTAQQVAQHNTQADCWLIISGNVYNVTDFIPIHPGGTAIVPYCGADATAVFNSIHGSTGTAASLLPTYLIGALITVLTAPSNVAGTPAAVSVNLTWTASSGGVAPITYSIVRGGVTVGTTTAASFTDTGLATSTTYSYVITATDSAAPTANTASSAAINVTTLANPQTDTTPPLIALIAPPNGATVSGTTTITTEASDNVGVVKVELYINGQLSATSSTSPYTFVWDTTTVANGSYALLAKAYDAAGNVGVSGVTTITINNSASGNGGGNVGDDRNENEHETGNDNEVETEHQQNNQGGQQNNHEHEGNHQGSGGQSGHSHSTGEGSGMDN